LLFAEYMDHKGVSSDFGTDLIVYLANNIRDTRPIETWLITCYRVDYFMELQVLRCPYKGHMSSGG